MARISSGLISIVAPLATTLGLTISPGKRVVIMKLRWINRTGANGFLRIGYNTIPGVFTPVFPDIMLVAGLEDGYAEDELPIMGNGPEGFSADTTPVTGTNGNIQLQATVGGAAPADVQVEMEVEEF